MTQSEYILPFVSIIYSLSAADLLVSLHRLLINRAAVNWHFLPLLWALVCFLMIINGWWGMFHITATVQIEHALDLLLLSLLPITTFFFSALALPHDVPREGLVMKRYFMDHVKPFYITLIAYLVIIPLVFSHLAATEINLQNILANSVLCLCLLAMVFVKNIKAHTVLALLVLLSMLGTLSDQGIVLSR